MKQRTERARFRDGEISSTIVPVLQVLSLLVCFVHYFLDMHSQGHATRNMDIANFVLFRFRLLS